MKRKTKRISDLGKRRYSTNRKQSKLMYQGIMMVCTIVIVVVFILVRSPIGAQNVKTPKGRSESPMSENKPLSDNWQLALVNSEHPLPKGYSVQLKKISKTHQVDERIADIAIAMIEDAKDNGVDLLICSSYRSVSRQQELLDDEIDKHITAGRTNDEALAEATLGLALPGHSEHNTGLALDIVTPNHQILDRGFEETEAFSWLDKNAYKYGFILRYPKGKTPITKIKYEPWHYRFVGREHATIIKEKSITLEEYLVELKENTKTTK